MIAFTSTLDFGKNSVNFRVNLDAPLGVKYVVAERNESTKWIILIYIAAAIFVLLAIYGLVTICMKSCKKEDVGQHEVG